MKKGYSSSPRVKTKNKGFATRKKDLSGKRCNSKKQLTVLLILKFCCSPDLRPPSLPIELVGLV
jgi:hypothetical protein